MESTAVLIPTFGRAHRVERLLDNLHASTRSPHTLYFVVECDDSATRVAVRRAGAKLILNRGPASYASCINTAYRATEEPYLFLGADDIVFLDGWLEAAVAAMTDADVGVVGTVDPYWPLPDHSSHSLVRRRYVEQRGGCADLRDTVLHPYWHGFTDHELIGVAKSRRAYVYCEASRVEHHHPGWDSVGRVRGGVALDRTYRKGNRNHRRDIATFVERSAQWMYRIDAPSGIDLDMRRFVSRHRGLGGSIRYGLRRCADTLRESSRHLLPTARDPARPRARPHGNDSGG